MYRLQRLPDSHLRRGTFFQFARATRSNLYSCSRKLKHTDDTAPRLDHLSQIQLLDLVELDL